MTGWFRFILPGLAVLGLQPGAGQAAPNIVSDKEAQLASLNITITGIRNDKGVIRLALCPPDSGFPDCGSKAVRTAALPIKNGKVSIAFTDLPPGRYAASLFHDSNENGRLDTFAGIPREGYGFSSNPPFRPRAPRFEECELELPGSGSITIRLRYLG